MKRSAKYTIIPSLKPLSRGFALSLLSLVAGLILSAGSTEAQAQASAQAAFVARVLATNPALQAQEAADRADALDLKAENRLQNPEFGFGYEFGQGHLGDKHSFALTQGFDWPGLYKARSEAAKAFEQARDKNRETMRRDLELKVWQLLTDLTYERRMLARYQEIYSSLVRLEQKLDSAVERRAATVIDLRKARLEAASAAIGLSERESRIAGIVAEIRGLSSDSSLVIPVSDSYYTFPVLSKAEYERQLRENDPATIAAESYAELARAQLKVSKRSLLPGFSLGVKRIRELGEYFTGFEVGISIPLWQGSAKKKAAQARLEAARLGITSAAVSASAQSQAASSKLESLDRKLKPLGDFFGAGDYLAPLKRALDARQITVLNYLTEASYYLDAAAKYEDLLYARQLELLSLNRYCLPRE